MTNQQLLLTRLAKLERENVELQEEILRLKQDLKHARTSRSRPSTPEKAIDRSLEFEQAVTSLKAQVLRAVEELKKYRVPEPHSANTKIDSKVDSVKKGNSPVVARKLTDDDDVFGPLNAVSSVPALVVSKRKPDKKDDFDLDDLLS